MRFLCIFIKGPIGDEIFDEFLPKILFETKNLWVFAEGPLEINFVGSCQGA